MVRYHINDVSEEMVLGESIILPSGKLLLAAGQKLQRHYCQKLSELGYSNVLISVEGTEGVLPETTVSERALHDMNGAIENTGVELACAFHEFRDRGVNGIKQFIRENRQHLGKFIMNSGLARALEQFIDEIANQPTVVLNLAAMQQARPGLVNHALNVAITSLCIGRKFKFSTDEMKQLGIGALNYDLGLIALPRELLDKPREAFNDEEMKLYRQHPVFGYIMLSQNHAIPPTASACALQHHEREDGSGFPRGIKGENRPPLKDFLRKGVIHRFAEIVAVADTYEMFLSGRSYEGAQKRSTQEAIKGLVGMSGKLLNTEIIKSLLAIVPLYPVGARVKITNAPSPQLIGYFGVIAKDNPHDLESPEIILYETKNKQKIKPILIDTAKHPGIVLELVI
jgi:HD-GYP domain-containing protein (c-di-GMP phosphodiesterase class II)